LKVTAVVPAAGSGTRMGGSTKKQFLTIGGTPILAHTLMRLAESPEVTEIIPVLPPDELEALLDSCVECSGVSKVKRVVPGGKTRQESVYNGLKALGPDVEYVMVHDGVRPFVPLELIEALLHALPGHDGAILAVPSKDTVKEVNHDCMVCRTLDRKMVYLVQTPQVFRRDVILDAYRRAFADGFHGTDESSLVERIGGKIKVVMGSYANIKITTPEDMALADAIYNKEKGDAPKLRAAGGSR